MKNKLMLLLSFVAGILISPLVLAMGAIDMGADVKPGFIERTIAPWARDRSVEKRAPKEKNPYAVDPAAPELRHLPWAHDVAGAESSKGINRPAPALDMGGDDGKLFWVIKHGTRMTAMPAIDPTHTDKEIWKIVAFGHHLPDLTADRAGTGFSAGSDRQRSASSYRGDQCPAREVNPQRTNQRMLIKLPEDQNA